MWFLDVLGEIYFKKFCKGVQGKKLFQKFFLCIEKLQDLLELL